MDYDDQQVIRRKHGLTLLRGRPSMPAHVILGICLGPKEEFDRAMERLRPRGQLTLAISNDAPSTDGLPPDAA